MAKRKLKQIETIEPLKLDIGCGPNKIEGFLGVDQYDMPGVDIVTDIRKTWPWAPETVGAVHCSHFLEHLTGPERVHFTNELYRVLIPGGQCTLITPHWASNRAYGDYTHQWPPVAEMWFYYLKRDWRLANAPHNDVKWDEDGYSCDFDCTWGYNMREDLHVKNTEQQQFALANYKEVATDMLATLTKSVKS